MGLTAVTDAAGRKKTIAYMASGAVVSVLDRDGNGCAYGFLYDANNQLLDIQILDVGMFTVNACT